jgi:2-oxoglutarate ferredoxin oxidoreductase subunit beta
MNAYGFNTVHGRALPIAQGVKLANPELLVVVAGGDGDGFSIGGGHIPHVARRNIDLTYLTLDNRIYGLTKGQLSPTSRVGLETKSSPWGAVEEPVNPILYVLAYGAKFVAQGTPADMDGLAQLIEEAIRFPGFAYINIHTPCITFGEIEDQIKAQKAQLKNLQACGHDASDRSAAFARALEGEETLYTGVFYRDPAPGPHLTEQFARRKTQREAAAGAPGPLARKRVLELLHDDSED